MNLLEAKMFEYFIKGFKKELDFRQNNNNYLPTYKILWESSNRLFFCNTYLDLKQFDCNPYSRKLYNIGGVNNQKFFTEFDKEIKTLFSSSKTGDFPDIEAKALYMNPLILFDCGINELDKIKKDHLPKSLDQTAIFNVQSFNSGHSQKLDFLKVGEDFELNPVSLIENKDKAESIELKYY